MPTWKYLLKSLYSNQTIIDGRKRPFYWALMFFVLSIFLMFVVPLAQGYQNDGRAIIQPQSDQGLSIALHQLSQDERFQSLYIEDGVLKDHSLADQPNFAREPAPGETNFFTQTNLANAVVGTGSGQVSWTAPVDTSYQFMSEITDDAGNTYNVPLLRVFSTSLDPNASREDLEELNDLMNAKIFRAGEEGDEGYLVAENRPVNRSFILFTPSDYYIYIYPLLPTNTESDEPTASTSSQATVFHGVFSAFKDTFEFSSLKCEGPYIAERNNEVVEKWGPLITTSYIPVRNAAIWRQVGITIGVSAGLIIVCGLIIWLFTLGRRNLLHRDCTLWQGLKMSATLSFTVAIIGMVTYFMAPLYSWMFGIMGMVLRTMWLIMKTTGGRAAPNNKPLYQAR